LTPVDEASRVVHELEKRMLGEAPRPRFASQERKMSSSGGYRQNKAHRLSLRLELRIERCQLGVW
jgi:hypothetical protein